MPSVLNAPNDWPATPFRLKVRLEPVDPGLSVRYCAISPASRAPRVRSSLVICVSRQYGRPGFPGCERGLDPCIINGRASSGRSLRFPSQRIALPVATATAVAAKNWFEIETGIEADLLKQIGAAGGRGERWQAELGKKLAHFSRRVP